MSCWDLVLPTGKDLMSGIGVIFLFAINSEVYIPCAPGLFIRMASSPAESFLQYPRDQECVIEGGALAALLRRAMGREA